MSVRSLSHRIGLFNARGEIHETLQQVQAHPLTQNHVLTYTGLLGQWTLVFNQELALRDGITAAKVRMFWIDVALNGLALRVSKALLTLISEDRTHPTYLAYFGKKTVSEFRRGVLGRQLEAMRLWLPQLMASGVPELVALGTEIAAQVTAADEATATHASLQQQHTFFREAGERKKFFDRASPLARIDPPLLTKTDPSLE